MRNRLAPTSPSLSPARHSPPPRPRTSLTHLAEKASPMRQRISANRRNKLKCKTLLDLESEIETPEADASSHIPSAAGRALFPGWPGPALRFLLRRTRRQS
jgi:hypothetical protein